MPDRRRLGVAIALRKDHVVNPRGIDPGAFHQRLENDGAELAGIERGETAGKFADRCSDRGDDGSAT